MAMTLTSGNGRATKVKGVLEATANHPKISIAIDRQTFDTIAREAHKRRASFALVARELIKRGLQND